MSKLAFQLGLKFRFDLHGIFSAYDISRTGLDWTGLVKRGLVKRGLVKRGLVNTETNKTRTDKRRTYFFSVASFPRKADSSWSDTLRDGILAMEKSLENRNL